MKNGELHSTDIGVCGVNLRLPTSRILAELFFAC